MGTRPACNSSNVTNVPGKLSMDISTVMNTSVTLIQDPTLDSSTMTPTSPITMISEVSTVKTHSSLMTLLLTGDKTAQELSANATNGSHMLSTSTSPSGANLDTEF